MSLNADLLNVIVLLFLFLKSFHGKSIYLTPAADDQFEYYNISSEIPQNGTNGGGVLQKPVILNEYDRRFFVFTFQGSGNALLRIQVAGQWPSLWTLQIEIGSGSESSKVSIHTVENGNVRSTLASTNVYGVTSEEDQRYYWISWDAVISIGLGTDPTQNILLRYDDQIYMKNVTFRFASISTASNIVGLWTYPSAGEAFGGCSESFPCENDGLECIKDKNSPVFGTCVFKFNGTETTGNSLYVSTTSMPRITSSSILSTRLTDKSSFSSTTTLSRWRSSPSKTSTGISNFIAMSSELNADLNIEASSTRWRSTTVIDNGEPRTKPSPSYRRTLPTNVPTTSSILGVTPMSITASHSKRTTAPSFYTSSNFNITSASYSIVTTSDVTSYSQSTTSVSSEKPINSGISIETTSFFDDVTNAAAVASVSGLLTVSSLGALVYRYTCSNIQINPLGAGAGKKADNKQ